MRNWDPATSAGGCTCNHPVDCYHECHGHLCDPDQHVCSIEYLPDDGGLTLVGCPACTPGEGAPHLTGCPAIISTAALAGRGGEDLPAGA